jgi:hypothetical protein
MKKFLFPILVFALLATAGLAQKSAKPWSEWSKDEVDKMLDKSPWGHVLTNTDTSEMTVTFGQANLGDGAKNQAVSWNYRIRFFSAKPIREALARKVMLANPSIKPQQLDRFINSDYSESIVIAVTFDSTDRRYLAEREKAFNLGTTEQLKNTVYLELKDGKRIPLAEYAPPSQDGTGAKFVFPRSIDDKPFVPDEKEIIRFVANFPNGVSFGYRFKVAEMMYDGKLEY